MIFKPQYKFKCKTYKQKPMGKRESPGPEVLLMYQPCKVEEFKDG